MQKSKDVRETWMDKIKRGNNMAKDPKLRRTLNTQHGSPLYSTAEKGIKYASNILTSVGGDTQAMTGRAGHSQVLTKPSGALNAHHTIHSVGDEIPGSRRNLKDIMSLDLDQGVSSFNQQNHPILIQNANNSPHRPIGLGGHLMNQRSATVSGNIDLVKAMNASMLD